MDDDRIEPLQGSHRIPALRRGDYVEPEPPHRHGLVIRGRIVSVAPGRPHAGEEHQLDVSIGGSAYAEIVLRVPSHAYAHLEGREATLHVDPA
ncbi:MAG: hypothetical protein RLZZ303_2330 [Candidatus Hydrogenedentota bacterium]